MYSAQHVLVCQESYCCCHIPALSAHIVGTFLPVADFDMGGRLGRHGAHTPQGEKKDVFSMAYLHIMSLRLKQEPVLTM